MAEPEHTPFPPVIFAGKWAKRYIRELEAERDELRTRVVAARIRLPVRPEAALLILGGEIPTPEREQEVRDVTASIPSDRVDAALDRFDEALAAVGEAYSALTRESDGAPDCSEEAVKKALDVLADFIVEGTRG